ncbi:TetR/AcrR family transcriptional regulator [Mycobacterium palustre]|uniref:TetR/AcrR family transcriptional regulator n=1 Tax=Mycobacterium palustre TaxID=153971 RepID=UPI001FEA1490|nr:TetR family transcriptional regulator C-terminal domain-containing protein [Mycobacterium palustre]
MDQHRGGYISKTPQKRTRDPLQRRQELCDAAIQVLADEGAKGLSHIKVDRRAQVPDGTTSVHFRTRKALIYAIAARVAELDMREFVSATDATHDAADSTDLMLSRLADLAMKSAEEPALSRTKARFELLMQAPRDPELMEIFRENTMRFAAMSLEAVAQLQPAGASPDPTLINDQAFAITTFIAGLQIGYVYGGERAMASAEKIDDYLHAVIEGVANRHQKNRFPAKG